MPVKNPEERERIRLYPPGKTYAGWEEITREIR
jgi:hypothetical protein